MNEKELDIIQRSFEKIKNASAGKKKKQVLAEILEDDHDGTVRKAFYYLLNPMMAYGVGEKSLMLNLTDYPITQTWGSVFDMLDDLNDKPGITYQDVANIKNAISDVKIELSGLLEGMILKSIRLGVTAKTVNEVAGETIVPAFSCMLANKYFEHPDYVKGKSFYVTEKLDGIRCLAIVRPDEPPRLFSRQGQPIKGLVEIEKDLQQLYRQVHKGFVLDGELLISDRDKYPSKLQYKETMKIVRSDKPEKTGITYNVFDIVDVDAFETQCCEMEYYLRRQKLAVYVRNVDHIKAVPIIYSGSDESVILDLVEEQRSMGHEGVMVNIADSFYQFKRTNELLKVKVMQDCDLRVIGVEEGSGKFAGTLGSLVVDYKGNPVGVGSGLSDGLRSAVWNSPDDFIGKIATVQYFEETEDDTGKKSIRFPVFKDWRDDKTEPSYN